jgi:hypothetical protein
MKPFENNIMIGQRVCACPGLDQALIGLLNNIVTRNAFKWTLGPLRGPMKFSQADKDSDQKG